MNPEDSTFLDSPAINVTASATYANGTWNIDVIAKADITFNSQVTTIVRKYLMSGEQLVPLAATVPNFASGLGRILEEMIANDLHSFNPTVEFTVQL